jgi:hypothetical protein
MKIKFLFLSLVISISAVAQDSYEYNEAGLLATLAKIKAEKIESNKRISEYLSSHPNELKSFVRDNVSYQLVDVINDVPQYYITHNQDAVRSVGADQVQQGGSLNIDLSGIISNIGVWDENLPRESHQEFGGRISNRNSMTAVSNHSTHVTGTIIANGVNPNARGFAFNAPIVAYDWFNDTEEMILEAMNNNILVSNHSYGIAAGWTGSGWRGDVSISDQEDFRFGFYTNNAARFDDVAFNAPFYTIVRSAGNDRNNVGDGSFPPDGPYDCISDFALSKNVITVGAVNKLDAPYQSPSDVIMSSFSSWGPVDDGRIKPDVVAPGVSVLSASNGGDDAYTLLSGTSMASPCVTGSVALVNELYFSLNNRFLRSSSIKALLIHTASETGESDGPDYSFGHGLINVEAAARHILDTDGINNFLVESVLQSGETFEVDLNPIPNEKITVTIVWTDPAGTPVANSLDPMDLMLVNDLDIQLIDEQGEITEPWILDPSNPSAPAVRGNNFRDNVEKIELYNPKQLGYTLRVSHKGSLRNGGQNFSLIIDYESDEDSAENIYWVGGDGNWSDNSHWSLTSGGPSANRIPESNNKVIFDNNSFPNSNGTARMDQDFTIAGLLGLSSSGINLDLSGNSLRSSEAFIFSSDQYQVRNGDLQFDNPTPERQIILNFDETQLSNVGITIEESNLATWNIASQNMELRNLIFNGGNFNISNSTISTEGLVISGSADSEFNLNNTTFNISDLDIGPDVSIVNNGLNSFNVNTSDSDISIRQNMSIDFNIENSTVRLSSEEIEIPSLTIAQSTINFLNDINVSNFSITGASDVIITAGSTLSLSDISIDSDASMIVALTSSVIGEKAQLAIDGRRKLCFDNLRIRDIDLIGENAVSIGEFSTIENADNWSIGSCGQLLFADFSPDFTCEGGVAFITDTSDGDVVEREWFVDGQRVFGDEVLYFGFETSGDHNVTLVVTDSDGNQQEFSTIIDVQPSSIQENSIIQNSTQLASLRLASEYQWFNFGVPIPGEVERTFLFNGNPGIYFVLTFEDGCNRKSEVLDISTATQEEILEDVLIAPNPFSERLVVQNKDITQKWDRVDIYNLLGELQRSYEDVDQLDINTQSWNSGIYLLRISNDSLNETIKLYKY